MRSILAFTLLLANPLAAAPATDLAGRIIGIGVVSPADDTNGDLVVDAADVTTLLLPPIPLIITSTTLESAVTMEVNQTLTFSFGEAVTGFNASDVAVAGATKGVLSGSGSSYTMAITGTGGTITVAVSERAVTPGNEAATFSNFYQDTWTITLQTTPSVVAMELIRIPAGTFSMGAPTTELNRFPDEALHTVTLTQDFYLGKTEVTQDQWEAIQPFPQPQSFPGGALPVHNVSWDEIALWLPALDAAITEAGTFRLPTESQWEYAARAGTTTRFNYGNGFGVDENCSAEAERIANMWYCGNDSPSGVKVVGQKLANAWGLRDMHGNVAEFCADVYESTYPETVTDPTGPISGTNRVFRGGGFNYGVVLCRSARRQNAAPMGRLSSLGFRVAAVR